MSSFLNIDVREDSMGVLLSELTSRQSLTEHDVQRIREAAYRQGGVDRRLAAEVFHANRLMSSQSDAWTELYLELLNDYFLRYQRGRYRLLKEDETTLLIWLGDDVSIANVEERRLALRILLRASNIPNQLQQRVLDAVSDNLLHHGERWLGLGKRSAGVIDALDMQLIRRLVYGITEEGIQEARGTIINFLLGLDQNARRFINPGSWRRLLIENIAQHLSFELSRAQDANGSPNADFMVALARLLDQNSSSADDASFANDVLVAARSMLPPMLPNFQNESQKA